MQVHQKSLEELKHRGDIFTTNTDKGGAVVRLDVNDSIKESKRQLNCPSETFKA